MVFNNTYVVVFAVDLHAWRNKLVRGTHLLDVNPQKNIEQKVQEQGGSKHVVTQLKTSTTYQRALSIVLTGLGGGRRPAAAERGGHAGRYTKHLAECR